MIFTINQLLTLTENKILNIIFTYSSIMAANHGYNLCPRPGNNRLGGNMMALYIQRAALTHNLTQDCFDYGNLVEAFGIQNNILTNADKLQIKTLIRHRTFVFDASTNLRQWRFIPRSSETDSRLRSYTSKPLCSVSLDTKPTG